MSGLSRRRFLEDSMFATVAALAASNTSHVLAADGTDKTSPNDKLSVAVVGVNGRGGSHLSAFAGRNGTEVTVICDADEEIGMKRVDAIAKKQGRAPKFVKDMREIFDDKSVDIVSTATPNHWHSLCAIWAMQAGKDVYVEKPVSHNVSEGRRAVEAARKYNRICQTGTQCRSMQGSIDAINYVKSGKIGEVKLARALCYKSRPSIGPKGTYAVPATVDYNLWAGPAPMAPVTRKKFHYDWHWIWDYGNGDLGNQGIHQMDVARWGLGVDALSSQVFSYGGRLGYEDAGETANSQIIFHQFGDKTLVFEVRGLPTDAYRDAKVGNIFHGTDGYVVLAKYTEGAAFDLKGNLVTKFVTPKGAGDNAHFDNFTAAVRSRKADTLNADILEGHLSSALCHTGNISYRLGSAMPLGEVKSRLQGTDQLETHERFVRHLADNKVADSTPVLFGQSLAFDPAKEVFLDNSAANAMLTRAYRAPFVVPAAGQV